MASLSQEVDGREWGGGPGLLASLWRYRLLVIAMTLLAGAVGYLYAMEQPTRYEASARLILRDPGAPGVLDTGPGPSQDVEPYVAQRAELVTSTPVLERASQILGGNPTASQLGGVIGVQADIEVISLTISAQAEDPQSAAARANAVGEAYQQVVSERGAGDAQRAIAKLEEQRNALQAELDASLAISQEAGITELTPQQQLLTARLSELRAAIDQINVQTSLAGSGVELFETAIEPKAPSEPKPVRDAALAAFVGLLAAGASAWWAAARYRTADDRTDPAEALRAPLLGEVPEVRVRARTAGDPIPTPEMLGPAASEAYHFVVASMEHLLANVGGSSVVITSVEPGDDRTFTALNLAISAFGDRRRTVLVDGDDRTRRLSNLCGRYGSPGLTDVGNEAVPVDLCIHHLQLADGTTIPVLPCGTELEHPAAFFRTPLFRKAVLRVAEQADLVLIDTPPILSVADTVAIASQADAVILVVHRGTRFSRLRAVRERLAFAGTPLLGYVYLRGSSPLGTMLGHVPRGARRAAAREDMANPYANS